VWLLSSGSSSGSGADQHLLALLRAIRLRQAAPDAAEAGAADTAAALTRPEDLAGRGPRAETEPAEEPNPEWEAGSVRPDWASSRLPETPPDDQDETDISEIGSAGEISVAGEAAAAEVPAVGSFFDRASVLRSPDGPLRDEPDDRHGEGRPAQSGEGRLRPGEGETGRLGEGVAGRLGEGVAGRLGEGAAGRLGEGAAGGPGAGAAGRPGADAAGRLGEGVAGLGARRR
jgi:hypothetical protein